MGNEIEKNFSPHIFVTMILVINTKNRYKHHPNTVTGYEWAKEAIAILSFPLSHLQQFVNSASLDLIIYEPLMSIL